MGLFFPVWRVCPFVPRNVLVLVFWWGRSQGEGFYTVEGDGVFPGPVAQGMEEIDNNPFFSIINPLHPIITRRNHEAGSSLAYLSYSPSTM